MNRSTELLVLNGLNVTFPIYNHESIVAVDDLNLKISAGKVVALVGESGSGKTTLARAIMGLIPLPGYIKSGSVEFLGQRLTELTDRELRIIRGKEIAMIIPNPRSELDPLLTIGDQLSEIAFTHLQITKKEARNKALSVLNDVSIPDPTRRLNAYPHELSGGMAQRVVIAMALICKPRIIISDDATSGLDVTVQAQILRLLRQLIIKQKSALLFITRDIGITAHFCDQIAIMYLGKIVEIAERKEFFKNPSHPYSVSLLAAFSHDRELRHTWAGEKPQINEMPKNGCLYSNRCKLKTDRCLSDSPALENLFETHYVRCFNPVERGF